jgi:tripartite-type tricarboxylate transporter receptor subunit TctC
LDHVAYSHLNSSRRPLDPFVDFVPVGSVNRDSWVVVVPADGPARRFEDLAARSRSEPLSFASNGEGSTAHLLSARLCQAAGIRAQHVPYQNPWMLDLIAGRVHFVIAPTPAVLPQLRAGRLAALATLTDERLALLPAPTPSVREMGLAGQVFHGGLFLFAPAPLAPFAGRLNAALREAVGQPEVVQRYREAAIEPTPLGLDETAVQVRQRLQTIDEMRRAVFGRTR